MTTFCWVGLGLVDFGVSGFQSFCGGGGESEKGGGGGGEIEKKKNTPCLRGGGLPSRPTTTFSLACFNGPTPFYNLPFSFKFLVSGGSYTEKHFPGISTEPKITPTFSWISIGVDRLPLDSVTCGPSALVPELNFDFFVIQGGEGFKTGLRVAKRGTSECP